MDTSGAKIWLPGISDPDTLDAASPLCGTTAMTETRTLTHDRFHHPDYYARHLVMTPEMIRQLPGRHALIVRGGMSPVIARLPMAWQDPAYKRARRHGHAIAAIAAIAGTAGPPFLTGDDGHDDGLDPWPGWDTPPRAPSPWRKRGQPVAVSLAVTTA
jgi:hypothetical protein